MLRIVRGTTFGIAIFIFANCAQAGTIIKLDLGSDSAADIEYTGGLGGTLSTADDGNPTTTGDQVTDIDFLDFLDASFPDITGSFSMDNLIALGNASTFNTLVIQNFTGGTINLYSTTNELLLSGMLANSALTGPIGFPATGALFTTSFASITGGSLQPLILQGTLTLSMSLTDINGGDGFSVSGTPSAVLGEFEASATLNIAADQIPEPLSMVLLAVGSALTAWAYRRR
jgi:hypothetical protein